jgi:glycosyltransferase involved in cell wall biosynthesis
MKVLHIVAGELTGGAAKGAYNLHRGLIKVGVDSKILTNSLNTLGDERVRSVISNKGLRIRNIIRNQLDSLPSFIYKNREKRIFSTGFFGLNLTKIKEYKEADIIHLHWINNGFVNIKHLNKVKKPIVWTMRDMWPMTGGCHYSLDCENYKTGCGHCKQLNSNKKRDLSRFIVRRKRKYFPRHIKLVGISSWLSDKAKESYLLKDFDIRTISNNIDTDEFFPVNKKEAREALGIKTNKKIILAGANNLKDFYKGFDKFLKSLQNLNSDDYFLCFFGKMEKEIKDKMKFEYKDFGYLEDTISLRLLYSASDVFVAPSIQEAFGKTLAEAMACETPVVCFDATGPKDIISHKVDGYKSKPFDSEDLATGIEWVLNNDDYDDLCKNARKKAVEKFDSKIIARKYVDLYKQILK